MALVRWGCLNSTRLLGSKANFPACRGGLPCAVVVLAPVSKPLALRRLGMLLLRFHLHDTIVAMAKAAAREKAVKRTLCLLPITSSA
mmetsp:Transcript_34001/g.65758  ORF Transcript_34001/g.65758 Transcript_34001/m.65758 type:complete len:87 (-) Transcript_34001:48-308(-)